MTQILVERATIEQALEALEAGPDVDPIFAGETEAALRAALAQQPEPAQEPLVWEPTWRLHALTQREYDALHEDLRWNYRRIATPKVEPVSAADLVQRIRELRDEAAKMFIESGSPGYKLHDLYRMKLDAILVAPPQQPDPAQPAQAPAYKVKVAGRWHDAEPFAAAFDLPDGEHLLYTAPPQRPPLTDEEMLDIIDDAFEGSSLLDVARAIERAVRGE